jgi:hypothetical protein
MIEIDPPSPSWSLSFPVALRRYVLFAVTGLAVAVARQIHTHKVLWTSVGDFLVAWFMGYVVLALTFIGAGVLIARWSAWFLEPTPSPTEPDLDQIVVYVTLTVLALAVGYLVLHGIGPSDPYAVTDW